MVSVLLCTQGFAQLNEQFSDGDFTSNPTWLGDDSLFQVNTSGQLQSKGSVSKDICLATSSSTTNGEWQCWALFNLSPSTSNFCRYYLMSDSANLKGSLNGYFIQFGGITGSNDSIMLFKQKGLVQTLIIGGRRGTVSKSINRVRIKVLRDNAGNWSLLSDTSGSYNFILEGTGTDNEFTTSTYAGVFVRYTSGNAANYYFDQLYAGPVIVDITPPVVDSVQVLSNNSMRITFSEQVQTASALDVANYSLSNGIGAPLSVAFENGSSHEVVATFFSQLTNKTNYTLSVSGIADTAGNVSVLQQIPFRYDEPILYDVLISEWMADPSPAVGLPEQEFIELYNNTSLPVKLGGWSVSDGGTPAILPDITLDPDSFLIVCATTNTALFATLGKTIGVSNFPSLNNSGDSLILRAANGTIIHRLLYDLSWYQDNTKTDGGWSVELINPNRLCIGKRNFSASTNPSGGTPGRVNSLWSKVPDTSPPTILQAWAESATQIKLVCSEPILLSSLSTTTITFSNGIGFISILLSGPDSDTLNVTTTPISSGVTISYQLSGIQDCAGNAVSNATGNVQWFQPDTAKTFDVLITEIMADPDPVVGLPAAEYIELYNRSTRTISLKGWKLLDGTGGVALPDMVLLPDSFVVLCSTSSAPLFTGVSNIKGLSGFPSLSNDGELLVLQNAQGQLIHSVNYLSSWYADNLKKSGGWSLEMVDTKNPCGGINNWMASKHVKGGTPGKPNASRTYNPDSRSPELLRAYPLSATALRLYFSEPVDSAALRPSFFNVNNGIGAPVSVTPLFPEFKTIDLSFSTALLPQTIYRIITDSLSDCAGNLIQSADYADYGLPEPFDSAQLIINEILFNPKTGSADFVEVYNNSGKIIDLKQMLVANVDEQNAVKDFYPIATDGYIVLPEQHIVLTENPSDVYQQYFGTNPTLLIACSLPSLNDDAGNCLLLDNNGKRYDLLAYDDDMHFALLDDKNGVSLERIDYNRPTSDRSNWTSAAASVGYATPTRRNSQYLKTASERATLKATPEVFSPDGDGYNDVVNIHINMTEPGHTATLSVYDSKGVLVKQLLRNDILGTADVITWDGVTDKNEKAPIGIYVVYLETFNTKGDTTKTKTTLVVGAKL